MLMFSPSPLLAGPPRYPLVNGDKFPTPSTECCRQTHQRRSPGAQHGYLHNGLVRFLLATVSSLDYPQLVSDRGPLLATTGRYQHCNIIADLVAGGQ